MKVTRKEMGKWMSPFGFTSAGTARAEFERFQETLNLALNSDWRFNDTALAKRDSGYTS
jgi:hypothetical protein